MNILFLSLQRITSIGESGIYTDVLRLFVKNGHNVIIISPIEKRFPDSSFMLREKNTVIIRPRIGNITNTAFIEKGISSVRYQKIIINCIQNEIDVDIDLFILATPPVNEDRIVRYVKKKYNSKVYLLLKDIWPASINDLKLPGGWLTKGLVSLFFRHYEKNLYKNVDVIGCMSEANIRYLSSHNSYLSEKKLQINPNSIELHETERITEEERREIRASYGIPQDAICFVYGGTLGIGQNVPHIINCLRECKNINCHFLIIGNGVQFQLLEEYKEKSKQKNITLLSTLPKNEYLRIMQSCDIGLIFLRYTAQTPNFPSRILSYMDYSMPILSCTDPVTDINEIIEDSHCGLGCLSDDPVKFRIAVEKMCKNDLLQMGEAGHKYMQDNFSAKRSYSAIMEWFENKEEK